LPPEPFRPARGARIETDNHSMRIPAGGDAFAPHAGRGLKRAGDENIRQGRAFAPHAGRGLKRAFGESWLALASVFRPARGARIETDV